MPALPVTRFLLWLASGRLRPDRDGSSVLSRMIARFTTTFTCLPASAAAWIKALLPKSPSIFRPREGAESGYFRFVLADEAHRLAGLIDLAGRHPRPHRSHERRPARQGRAPPAPSSSAGDELARLARHVHHAASCSARSLSNLVGEPGIRLHFATKSAANSFLRHRFFPRAAVGLDPTSAPRELPFRSATTTRRGRRQSGFNSSGEPLSRVTIQVRFLRSGPSDPCPQQLSASISTIIAIRGS